MTGAAVVSTEVERYDGIDPADVPSAKWGWSKINYRSGHIAGFVIIVFLVAMLHGNHTGRVEDIFVLIFAALATLVLVRDIWGRNRGWLR
jgi:Protein of unknown function (DUF2631)